MSSASRSRARRPRRLLLAPLGRRGWDRDDVAAHLLDRRAALVRSLAPRSPWTGIDHDTLNELYVEAVAKVVRIAGSHTRRDWRTHRDLERATIAAFRFEAQHYWQAVNAEKRRGDRDAVSFDPELHGEAAETLARIFDPGPHEELIARDWLAQLEGDARSFWTLLVEGVRFMEAAGRLDLSYDESKVLYRAGLEQLSRFRALQEAGKVCQLRAPAIAALRAGTADELTVERARAHLACCLPCALVHERDASALRRGILHVLPLPAVVRALGRVRELVGDRAAEAATAGGATGVGGAFLLSNGTTTALLCAGALAGGACVVGIAPFPSLPHAHHAHHAAHRLASVATPSGSTTPATLAPALSNTFAAVSPTPRSGSVKQPRARTTEFGAPPRTKPRSSGSTAPTSAQAAEFSPENAGTASTASSSSPTASTASTRPSSRSTSSPTSSTTTSRSSPTPASSSEFGGP